MTPEKTFNPAELAALNAALTSDKWRETEWSMYGELAMEVAQAAIAAEREACAKIFDGYKQNSFTGDQIAAAIRARGNEQ